MKIINQFFMAAFILGIPAIPIALAGESNQTNLQVVALMVVAPAGGTDNRNIGLSDPI